MTREEAMTLLTREPARVGRWCGYPLLQDELHGPWLQQMINGRKDMTLLAHRSSCKTTCVALALAIHCLIHPRFSMLFFRKTGEDALEILRQVKLILETEAMQVLSAALYQTPVQVKRFAAGELTCDCYGALRGAAQLTAAGIGESITGRHGELIFTDDIVNLKDRISQPERLHTRQVYMELQNIRTPGGRIINTGTPWHPEDAISLMPNIRRYDCYHTGLITPERLQALRQSLTPALFAANYELRHIASGTALFSESPAFFSQEEALYEGIAQVDAAYGGGDGTALTIGRAEGGRILLYGRLWQRPVNDVLPEILQECLRLRAAPVWCETNGDKGYLGREIRRLGLPVRLYQERQNKLVKITGYLRKWWPRVSFLQGTDPEYLNQILDYSELSAHDDAPDSAAVLIRALEGMGKIEGIGEEKHM